MSFCNKILHEIYYNSHLRISPIEFITFKNISYADKACNSLTSADAVQNKSILYVQLLDYKTLDGTLINFFMSSQIK